MRHARRAPAAVLGLDVQASPTQLRTMLSRSKRDAQDAVVVQRTIERPADQVRSIFVHRLGDWGDVVAWAGCGDAASAGRVHGLVRFGAAWTETDGSLCRDFRLCSDPTTVLDSIRCPPHPRLCGQVRVVGVGGDRHDVTLTGRAQGPAGWIGRVPTDESKWAPTTVARVTQLAEVSAVQLERSSVGDPAVVDVMRLPLPASGVPAARSA